MRTLRAIVSRIFGPRGRAATARDACGAALFWLALVIVVAALAPARAQTTGAPPTVPVIKPKVTSATNYVELTGNAASVRSVKLIARVGGYLEEQHFHDGAFVKKGDLLFKIQQEQYKAQLQQAQSQVLAAKAALVYARTEVVRYRSW